MMLRGVFQFIAGSTVPRATEVRSLICNPRCCSSSRYTGTSSRRKEPGMRITTVVSSVRQASIGGTIGAVFANGIEVIYTAKDWVSHFGSLSVPILLLPIIRELSYVVLEARSFNKPPCPSCLPLGLHIPTIRCPRSHPNLMLKSSRFSRFL